MRDWGGSRRARRGGVALAGWALVWALTAGAAEDDAIFPSLPDGVEMASFPVEPPEAPTWAADASPPPASPAAEPAAMEAPAAFSERPWSDAVPLIVDDRPATCSPATVFSPDSASCCVDVTPPAATVAPAPVLGRPPQLLYDSTFATGSAEGRVARAAADFSPGPEPADGIISLRQTATVRLGGEAYLDAFAKWRDVGPEAGGGRMERSSFQTGSANLRFLVEARPDVILNLKLDLSTANARDDGDHLDLLEECRIAFENVGGTHWSLLFGKGEVPYGQDRSLGILQSYNHNADSIETSEGPGFVLADPEAVAGDVGRAPGSTARPGELDRRFQLGVNYHWRDTVFVELAVFQDDVRFDSGRRRTADNFASFAARVWWTPTEEWTFQASGVRRHSDWMGDPDNRDDLVRPNRAVDDEYAVSLGAQWEGERWFAFGEYEHGWDWNFVSGYDTDQYQLGFGRRFGRAWTAGLTGEWLRIHNDADGTEDWRRIVATLKWQSERGPFVVGEYAREWYSGTPPGERRRSAKGDFLGMRVGYIF